MEGAISPGRANALSDPAQGWKEHGLIVPGDTGVAVTIDILWFDHTGLGLRARGGGDLVGFYLAGPDRRFHPAIAKLDGHTVVASCTAVPVPVAVRYAWGNDPPNNLVNSAGLPASPFRSDNWPDAVMPKF
jgi:hypothetical protein